MFPIEPWAVTEPELSFERLAQTETIFALSNGHIGLRGTLDEGEPHVVPGTYLNGFFESLPLPYAEVSYGNPEEGQSLINVTDGKLIRLLVDDEPFDVRHGELRHHTRTLDLRAGVLRRELEWVSPAGQAVRVRSTRLVSFAQRAIAAIRYQVEAVEASARIVVQSTLLANEPLAGRDEDDPRKAAVLRAPLAGEFHAANDLEGALGHRTNMSGLRMAAAMDHVVEGPESTVTHRESEADLARVTISTELQPDESLTVVKFVAYGWSAHRSLPALRDQVDAALASAKRSGWEGLETAQRKHLDDVWDRVNVEVDGDPELQQALHFAVFQVLQAATRAEKRAIPAKGLTSRGYDGHTFWDTETYTLPVLTYSAPNAARDALLWRHSTLPQARTRARELRLAGAAFPWRTIRGEECSGYWPAGTAAFHINADVADAVRRYVNATDDTEFERREGIELLVETARLWAALGHHDAEGRFRIDGVTGPDEYSALVDNNVFTNLMAARNLRTAADVAERHPERAEELGVDEAELAAWRSAADAMVIPYDAEIGVTAQSSGFTRYRRWDFDATPSENYPLLLTYPYYVLYSSQVVKQADLVFALYTCGDQFDAEQKRRDFAYYEPITVRDSSLSASIQAVVAAETGHLELAYDYLRESALIDLRDLAGNTDDGIHLASLAGSLLAAVAGFGGLRDYGDTLAFAPVLPPALTRLSFRMLYRRRRLRVAISDRETRYELTSRSKPLEILHYGERVRLEPGSSVTLPWEPPAPPAEPVGPPPGRDAGVPLNDR